MKTSSIIMVAISFLSFAGCTELSSMDPNAQVVSISGREFAVGRLAGQRNAFYGRPNNVDAATLWYGDMSIFPQNVKAIEKATGCRVIPESIVNSGIKTDAAVNCSH